MPRASRDSIMAKKAREKSIVTKQTAMIELQAKADDIEARQKAFSDALLEGHSKADAARAAGYHPSHVDKVLRTEEVQMYLADARQEMRDISTIKRIDVLNIFMEAVDMARTLADPAQMINGAKEIGKMLGYYEPEKLDITVSMDSNVLASKMRQMTDDELYALAAKKAKPVDGEVISDV